MQKLICFAFLFILTIFPVFAYADEVIYDYQTLIRVNTDGSLHVTETIDVQAEGNKINRGIYRDFPMYRRTFLGGLLPSNYEINSIRKNGVYEPWHTETDLDNANLRLYIGQSDVMIPMGRYVYEIDYTIRDQVFFFEGYDELYWNAIGTGWEFPILKASAKIILPPNAIINDVTAYTGYATFTGKDYEAQTQNNIVTIHTTKTLNANEGLTIAISWPKGFIQENPEMSGTAFFWTQHPHLNVMLSFLLFLCAYYYIAWKKCGVDPKSRGLAPFYTPPDGISPAMAAYIDSMGSADSSKCMTAGMVSLAAKGYLKIQEDGRKKYTITRTTPKNEQTKITDDERILYDATSSQTTLSSRSDPDMVKASNAQMLELKKLCHGIYFFSNAGVWAIGILIFIASVIFLGSTSKAPETFWMGITFGAAFGGIGMGIAISGLIQLFKRNNLGNTAGSVFMIIWGVAFSSGGVLGFYFMSQHLSWLVIAVIFIMIILIVLMRGIMKAPTRKGREIMDHLNGLRYYMSAVEEKILKKFDPPQMSRELYEEYLPYAIALGVESKWADKFALALGASALAAATASTINTSPSWYSGSSSAGGFSASSMVSSFGSALSAASTSQSSGSGGGGSSGGGGGGGGGGGW